MVLIGKLTRNTLQTQGGIMNKKMSNQQGREVKLTCRYADNRTKVFSYLTDDGVGICTLDEGPRLAPTMAHFHLLLNGKIVDAIDLREYEWRQFQDRGVEVPFIKSVLNGMSLDEAYHRLLGTTVFVHVTSEADSKTLHPDDANVIGIYEVTVIANTSRNVLANVALDAFVKHWDTGFTKRNLTATVRLTQDAKSPEFIRSSDDDVVNMSGYAYDITRVNSVVSDLEVPVRAYLHPTSDICVSTHDWAYQNPRKLVALDEVTDRLAQRKDEHIQYAQKHIDEVAKIYAEHPDVQQALEYLSARLAADKPLRGFLEKLPPVQPSSGESIAQLMRERG